MSIQRELAILAMKATNVLAGFDFLRQRDTETPVPSVPGVIPAVAREPFSSEKLGQPFDLLVVFTIGDFPSSEHCSSYYDPNSAWYNVFYGAYGIRSYKPDGVAWGYKSPGVPDYDEILKVPALDYNDLTAGPLGCPPQKRCFKATKVTPSKKNGWDFAEVEATIPSGLHHVRDAVDPDLTYYAVFGVPDDTFLAGRTSYEPVKMRGQMFFREVAPRITLVWGGMCPDSPAGSELLQTIIGAMMPKYP